MVQSHAISVKVVSSHHQILLSRLVELDVTHLVMLIVLQDVLEIVQQDVLVDV